MGYWSTVDAVEEDGSRQESFGEQSSEGSITLRCPWANRGALVADILGNRRAYPGWPVGGRIPQASQASIVPAGDKDNWTTTGSNQAFVPNEALVTIRYTTLVVDLITESLEPTAEFIQLDHKMFRWGAANGDPLKEGEAPGYLLRGLNWVRSKQDQSTPPGADFLLAVGHCNQSSVTSSLLGFTFDVETLLYNPPTLERVLKSDGTAKYSYTTKFTYKPEGWNQYFRAKTQTWEKIYIAGSGEYKSYPTTDLSVLI